MNTGHESLLAADKPSFGSQFLFHFDDIMVLAFIIVLGITVCTPLYLLRLAFRLVYVLWRIGVVGLLALVPVGKTLVGFYMFTRAAILLLTIFTIFSVPFGEFTFNNSSIRYVAHLDIALSSYLSTISLLARKLCMNVKIIIRDYFLNAARAPIEYRVYNFNVFVLS